MSANIICILIAIVVYLAGMIAIGVYYSKGQSDAHEFYLGGRKLGPIVTALSTEASDMSAWLLMGVPGLAFFYGIAEASWTAIGLALGTYLNWLFVAKRLRRYSVRLGAITLPEYIARRFRDNTLAETWYGRTFIHAYYAISPTLVKWFGETAWFKNMWKPTLDRMVARLNGEGVENTPYNDREW